MSSQCTVTLLFGYQLPDEPAPEQDTETWVHGLRLQHLALVWADGGAYFLGVSVQSLWDPTRGKGFAGVSADAVRAWADYSPSDVLPLPRQSCAAELFRVGRELGVKPSWWLVHDRS